MLEGLFNADISYALGLGAVGLLCIKKNYLCSWSFYTKTLPII
jgi:hypothetical protein